MARTEGETSQDKKMIQLKSSDEVDFEVEEAVAMESLTIKLIIDDDCADNAIPLPNVTAKILSKVIDYCKRHAEAATNNMAATDTDTDYNAAAAEELKTWDADFVKVDQKTLFDLMLAANYLNIKGLMDLTFQTAADMIKNMSIKEVRKTFNIDNDYSPEEEAAVLAENAWAFD